MNHSEIYSRLNAELANPRWSWGAIDKQKRFVALTGWAEEIQRRDGVWAIKVSASKKWNNKPGLRERNRHLDMIREGMASVVVKADMRSPELREIGSLDKDVFIGGELVDWDGDTYLTLTKRVDSAKINEVFA